MRRSVRTGLVVGLTLAALAAVAWAEEPLSSRSAPLEVRVFTIHYRPVDDAALLVADFLGPRGSYRIQPALKAVTVEDEGERLEQIARVLAAFDVAPPSVVFTVHLIRASEQGESPESFSGEIRGVTESLRDLTRWTQFRRIGTVSLECPEGSTAEAGFPPSRYRMELGVDLVQRRPGRVRVAPFRLLEEDRNDGGEKVLAKIFGFSRMNLRDGRMLTLAATSNERSAEALFVAIQARIED